MSALPVGTMIGPYAVEGVLGAGGFGITYRCRDLSGRLVAIKELFPRDIVHRLGTDLVVSHFEDRGIYRDLLLKFIDEGILLRDNLHHPGIVKVREIFSRHETAYIVMDYIPGQTLGNYTAGRTVLPEEFRSIFEAILEALSAVHDAGILHRDLSLSNVLVYERSGELRPVLIDFGASGADMLARRRDSSMIIANKGFAPPEQLALDGTERVHGPFTDLFALGAMMYTAIRGTRPADVVTRWSALAFGRPDPFEALASLSAVARVFPAQWLRAIDTSLALQPEKRPQSITEFRRALGWATADDTTLLLSAPPRRRRRVGLVTLVLACAVIAGLGIVYSQRPVRDGPPPATVVSTNEGREATVKAPSSDGALAPPAPMPLPPSKPVGRVLPYSAAPSPAIASKAVLFEEGLGGSTQNVISPGKVTWRVVRESPGKGKPPVTMIKGQVEVPDRGLQLALSIQPNADPSFPASHLIELKFQIPPDFDNKGVSNVPGLILKQTEQARGDRLDGIAARISAGFFWVALSAPEAAKTKNLGLLRERSWIDIPILFDNGRRGVLTLEKAGVGDRVVADALAEWEAGR